MFKAIKNNIPNFLTLMNLLSGIIAVIFSFDAFGLTGTMEGWRWAVLMIGIAALFDFFDGATARLLGVVSPIGKELDSLSDLVSFGVAPGLLLMNVLLAAGAGAWAYTALFLPLMGAVRLAKFNVDTTQTTEFKGLPIPANAIFWIGMVAAVATGKIAIEVHVAVALIIVFGLLMVCRLRMFSLKFHTLRLRGNLLRYGIIIATVVLLALLGLPGLSLIICLYILLSVFSGIVKFE